MVSLRHLLALASFALVAGCAAPDVGEDVGSGAGASSASEATCKPFLLDVSALGPRSMSVARACAPDGTSFMVLGYEAPNLRFRFQTLGKDEKEAFDRRLVGFVTEGVPAATTQFFQAEVEPAARALEGASAEAFEEGRERLIASVEAHLLSLP